MNGYSLSRPTIAADAKQFVERVYFPSSDCYVYATNHLDVRLQVPFYGWILVSIDDVPIRIRTGGQIIEERAMAVWARDVEFLSPPVRFITIALNPFHRLFRAFTKIAEPGAIALDRSAFSGLQDQMMRALTAAEFTQDEAIALKRAVIAVCSASLPPIDPLDSRAQHLMTLLVENPHCSLSDLAKSLKLSYHRTSHLFTHAVGIPVRTFQLWQKLYRANGPLTTGASLTEAALTAGFVDSAHYSNAFQTAFGRSPREAFKVRSFVVYQPDAFSTAAIGDALRANAVG